ncbi:lambda-crystallin-like isoform X2 [Littorina saxatilis]
MTLTSQGLSRGKLDPEEQLKHVTLTDNLAECVKDAGVIMEAVPEVMEVKKKVFEQVDDVMKDDAILSSSTSSMLPSVLSADLKHRQQFLVMHPVNPPFHVRAVELVPAPWTSGDVMQRSRALMVRLGQAPVVMKKEIEGFVLNRMQFAILGESWRLLKEGVVGVDGINKAVWSGLGPRYAFLGPFQVGHLNGPGIKTYLDKYGPTILRLQSSMGPAGLMGGELAEEVEREMIKEVPLDRLAERRRWREVRIAHLSKLKRDIDLQEKKEIEEGKLEPLP